MKKGLFFLIMAAFLLAAFPLVSLGEVDYGTQLTLNYGDVTLYPMEMTWSPDGKWIAFRANYDIWVVPVEGGTPVMVSAPQDSTMANTLPHIYPPYVKAFYAAFEPCFTPDSKEITFSRMVTQMGDGGFPVGRAISYIEARNIATGELRTVRADAYGGSFSSDGKYLAYIQHASAFDSINNKYPEVILYDIENDVATSYPEIFNTLGRLNMNRVRISPDNTWLEFEAQRTSLLGDIGNYDIYRMPISGGTIEKLTPNTTTGTTYYYYSSISPDGKYILYTRMDITPQGEVPSASMNLYNVVTEKTTTWFPESAAWGTMMGCFSPDGTKILYSQIFNKGSVMGPKDIFIRDFTPPEDDTTPTGVEAVVPAGFALTGNYPNPFNPTTTISFSLPSFGAANLSIYSVTGQKVRELVSGPMSAGAHSVVWDGRDSSGEGVSSGVYLSRLSQGSHTTAGRMLLAK